MPQNPYDSPTASQSSSGTASRNQTTSQTAFGVVLTMVVILSVTAILGLVMLGPFAWLLRDGLGPDSTTSSGWSAIERMFWCFYWGPLTLSATLICGAASLSLYRLTTTDQPDTP